MVDAAATTREQVTITKNGSPAAVLIGVDEWESIQESLFWLSQPGIQESIAEAAADDRKAVSTRRSRSVRGSACPRVTIRNERGKLRGLEAGPVTHEVIFTANARRDLAPIPPRIVPAIIELAFGDLARTPRKVGRPLKGELEGAHSARRGSYRNRYNISDAANRVEIPRVDHRAGVLPQRLIAARRNLELIVPRRVAL